VKAGGRTLWDKRKRADDRFPEAAEILQQLRAGG
jgi:hypothetical protein